jgi:acetyltransferase-like isoleucine patch superfamily enzyme
VLLTPDMFTRRVGLMSGTEFDEVLDRVLVHRSARVDVEQFEAGPGTVVNAHARVFGRAVHLGREAWVDEHATIGGGSAFDADAGLVAGAWLHMGNYSQINIARGVRIGDEVGIGIGSRIFTHGSYLSEWSGFPVDFAPVGIGSRVWLPNAQVNPGVQIGDDVVVAAGSIVTKDIPSGSFAAGAPAVVRGASSRGPLAPERRAEVLARLVREINAISGCQASADAEAGTLIAGETVFDLDAGTVAGPVTPFAESARNQLRRRGIRFRFEAHDGAYRPWPESISREG